MKLFLHTSTHIRIISGDLEWNGSPVEFQAKEPAYPGLPTLTQAPAAVRYQTPELKYIEDTIGIRYPDLFDALPYCDNIASYAQSGPAVYVHLLLDKNVLLTNDPEDCIQALAELKASALNTEPNLPIDATWPINLRSKTGHVIDNILIPFVAGQAVFAYRYTAGLPLGEYRVDESDFDPIVLGGVTYQVRLAQIVRFTLTRQLLEM